MFQQSVAPSMARIVKVSLNRIGASKLRSMWEAFPGQ